MDAGYVKENALYIAKKETQVAGDALRPLSNVELYMCRIIAKEREQILHVRIKIANTKFDLFKRALVTYHLAPLFRNFCWNVNQGRNLILHGEGGRWWKVC